MGRGMGLIDAGVYDAAERIRHFMGTMWISPFNFLNQRYVFAEVQFPF